MGFRAYDLLKLVEEHGESLTLRKKTYGDYDPATSTVSSTSTSDNVITAYFYNYELGIADLSNINRGMRKCAISALGLAVVPDTEDEILGNGDTVHITNVLTMYSAGQAICYICDVRE
jgi:hypothetical protein